MNDFELSPERTAGIRRTETLSRKINILLDVILSESGKRFDYTSIRHGANEAGYCLSRTRWSLLKNGKPQIVPDECLVALAAVFDVDAGYLLGEDAKLPERVESQLGLVRQQRISAVRDYSAGLLGLLDPDVLQRIVKILDAAAASDIYPGTVPATWTGTR